MDVITEPWRRRMVAAAGVPVAGDVTAVEAVEDLRGQNPVTVPKAAELITCRWCAGMWVSLGVVAARRLAPRLWDPLARALAFSAGAALLAALED